MVLTAGAHLGPYEILAPLGAGGMGEVYRARDTRLDRTVAIKVLPAELARDAARRQRLEREAKAISQLSHPHICTLYDVGREDEMDFLVMECLEGETLAHRLEKGPLPLEQALRTAAEIADALDKAHRQGIVHRDLKPGNVMLTKSGAKLLDFGLAKLRAPGSSVEEGVAVSALPTEAKPLTEEGKILGTYPYMAPEQLEGGVVDARTDVFAFGAVLYETVTGQRAFQGTSRASVIAAILDHDPPPVSILQPLSPVGLDHVVTTCLAKDPDNRWQSAHDVMAELQWVMERHAGIGESFRPSARVLRRRYALWTASLVLVAALTATATIYCREPPAPPAAMRFAIHPPPGATFSRYSWSTPHISPDGRLLAFHANDASGRRIWLRPFDRLEARPLRGTEDARHLFWSADGRSIAFNSGGKLKRIDVSDGAPRTLCDGVAVYGGTWNRNNVIVFGQYYGPLQRLSASGGIPTPVTQLDESRLELGHRFPQFLPDGRHFLYFVLSKDPESTGTYVGSLNGSEAARRVLAQGSVALYTPEGHLLFMRENTLLAQPFDARRLETVGVPVPVASPVGRMTEEPFASASETGIVVYRPWQEATSQLVWFDRQGRELERLRLPDGSQNPELSPDGQRLAFEVRDPDTGTRDVWLTDLAGGAPVRLTFDVSDDADPVWSPDGMRILFASTREGTANLHSMPARSGSGSIEAIRIAEGNQWTMSLSPDGTHVLYWQFPGRDIWMLPLTDPREPIAVAVTDFEVLSGQFSPDGRWVAYSSDESGRHEVYVSALQPLGEKWRVSTEGGRVARWRSDGRELFYIAPDRMLMGVEVGFEEGSFLASEPHPLFQTRASGPLGWGVRFNYAVSGDGQRFLINSEVGESRTSTIVVLTNWTALLGE